MPCRCCCGQLPEQYEFVTTIKLSPDGEAVWMFDSGQTENIGCLSGGRYFSYSTDNSAVGPITDANMRLLALDGSLLNTEPVASADAIGLLTNAGSVPLASGGIAIVGMIPGNFFDSILFWDADGEQTGSRYFGDDDGLNFLLADQDAGISAVGDNVCVRLATNNGFVWIAPDGSIAGSEPSSAWTPAGDALGAAGGILSFGSEVLLCGPFDVNSNGSYDSETDHRYRFYDSSGGVNSGVVSATGNMVYVTRYGSNNYALIASSGSITKVTNGGSASTNSITGFTGNLIGGLYYSVAEDAAGNLLIGTDSTLHSYPQTGGAPNWTVSDSAAFQILCDQNGNVYTSAGALVKKYNSSGVLQWTFVCPESEFAAGSASTPPLRHAKNQMHIDEFGCIYKTGIRAEVQTDGIGRI
jgi:hypothetical protein